MKSFWLKTQIPELLKPDSMYRFLAISLLEAAAEKGYDVEQLETACKRFERAQQFGDRIETANFFDDVAETLHPYSWYLEQISKGQKGAEFDVYQVPNCKQPMYRKHDGKKIESLTCVAFGGVFQGATIQSTIQAQNNAGELTFDGKNAALQAHFIAKINGMEILLKKRERTIADLTAEIEKLKLLLEAKNEPITDERN